MEVATLVCIGWKVLLDYRNDATLKVRHDANGLQSLTTLNTTLM